MIDILFITDKKAGHEAISKGIISFIKKYHEVNITEVYAKRRYKFLNKVGTFICNYIQLNPQNILWFLSFIYKDVKIDFNKKYTFVVSTGGDTSFLNIFLSKYFNIPNIYCSSLRGLKPQLFSYIVSIIDHDIENEIVVDLAPVDVKLNEKELDGKFISILIGGSTKNHNFKDDEFVELVERTILLAREKKYKIFLTTSRRTPLRVEKKLKQIYKNNIEIFEKAVFFNEKPQKVINYFLSNSDIIFCTEDSGSMITEAILFKKKVYTIRPKAIKLDKIFKVFVSNLSEKRLIYPISIQELSKITFDEKFNKINSLPAQIVYDKIKKVLE